MAAKPSSAQFGEQAEGIWKMLDDLSDSDPEAYQKFLEKTFKEHKELSEPPLPRFCVCSSLLPEIIQHKFYINICSWKQIPPPKTETDPIPVMAGEVKEIMEDNGSYSVVDTLFNPVILDKVADKENDKRLLVQLAIEYIQNTKNISISPNYKEMRTKYKGDVQNLKGFIKQPQMKLPQEQVKVTENPQTLLEQLSSIASSPDEKSVDSPLNIFDKKSEQCPVNLIEEVSSSKSAPIYSMTVQEKTVELPARVVVVVQLPDVHSIQEDVELKVSKVDLMLCAPNMKNLHVNFPQDVDDSKSKAVFNKKKHKLTVTVPVLQ